jgi:hypothetical protein
MVGASRLSISCGIVSPTPNVFSSTYKVQSSVSIHFTENNINSSRGIDILHFLRPDFALVLR